MKITKSSCFRALALLGLIALVFTLPLCAQATAPVTTPTANAVPFPSQFFAGAVSFNDQTSPKINGHLIYAPYVGSGVYNFTSVDISSVTRSPFRLQTAISTGAAKYMGAFAGASWFAEGTAGVAVSPGAVTPIATSPTNIGLALSGGVVGAWKIKGSVFALVTAKVLYTSTGGIEGPIGIGIGWGK